MLDLILTPSVLYVVGVLAVGAYALVRVLWWLRRASQLRRESFMARAGAIDPVETSDAMVDRTDRRDRMLDAIDRDFTVSRRLVVPLTALAVVILAGIPFLPNVPRAYLSVFVAAVTVVAGITLRPLIENTIAGLVVSYSNLIRLGDTVSIDGKYGAVEDITLTHTTIKIWDWRRYVVPNAEMLRTRFVNHSLFDSYIWAHVKFWVSYEADLAEVEAIAKASPVGSEAYLETDSEPSFWVIELDRDAIECWAAAWAASPSEAWTLKCDMRTNIVRELDARGYRPHLRYEKIDLRREPEV